MTGRPMRLVLGAGFVTVAAILFFAPEAIHISLRISSKPAAGLVSGCLPSNTFL
jgi:hypothetical protein